MQLCYSLNNSQGKVKEEKKPFSKVTCSRHNLTFKSHGIWVLIRTLQRRKKITRKVSNQESWNLAYLFPIHKENKFIPCLVWSHPAHLPNFTQTGPQTTLVRAAKHRAPATPQVTQVCLNNVGLYFYISAPWNPTLYKRQWRGVPAAFGWCFCSLNDRKGAEWPAPFYI